MKSANIWRPFLFSFFPCLRRFFSTPHRRISACTYTRVYTIFSARAVIPSESNLFIGWWRWRWWWSNAKNIERAVAATNTDGPRYLERKIVKTKTIEQIRGKEGYVIRLYNTNRYWHLETDATVLWYRIKKKRKDKKPKSMRHVYSYT